jgi:hypothetical protein
MTREPSPVSFVVTFKPTIAGIDPIRALRATLKFALRRFGLKCVDAQEIQADEPARAPIALTDGRRN